MVGTGLGETTETEFTDDKKATGNRYVSKVLASNSEGRRWYDVRDDWLWASARAMSEWEGATLADSRVVAIDLGTSAPVGLTGVVVGLVSTSQLDAAPVGYPTLLDHLQ